MIYFVTEAYLKLNTSITNNVDVTELTPLLKTAADMWVRSILGTFFYNDLLVKFQAQTLNANEVIIVQDYIQPSVAWRAAADAVIELSYQLKNKGIQTQSGDFSAATDMKSVAFNQHHYREKADFYDQRLTTYLYDNQALYPAFLNILNNDSTVKSQNCNNMSLNAFNSGITII